ncbi:MAG: DUF4380 domain-containing protein [Defluviitaleaceae bacterium]|nr:DUF4380 domain-containing protein [Defluviitaleaceae bacterium]
MAKNENITISQITDPNFGKCACITNGKIEVYVTLDFGPRVIHCACVGLENIFYQDIAKKTLGEKYDIYEDQIILYGGHRLWISPEVVPRCYHPDNQPVTFTEIENGARFTAAVEKHNQIQKIMTLTMDPDSSRVKPVHSIRNVGQWDIQLAPWAITMLSPGGIEVMPMPDRSTGFLPNRGFTFWDYTELNDSRLYLGKDFITLSQDASKQNAFKLGYNNEAGWAAYFNKGQIFIKYFEPTIDGIYPDNGCCFETYTNGDMLEMETLGEMYELQPDDFVTLEEEWELYPADKLTNAQDEIQLKAALDKFLV